MRSAVARRWYSFTAPRKVLDSHFDAVPFDTSPTSTVSTRPPAASIRSTTSACTWSDRTSRLKYATTTTSTSPASTASTARSRPGRLARVAPPETFELLNDTGQLEVGAGAGRLDPFALVAGGAGVVASPRDANDPESALGEYLSGHGVYSNTASPRAVEKPLRGESNPRNHPAVLTEPFRCKRHKAGKSYSPANRGVWRGTARQGTTRHVQAWHVLAWRGQAWQGKARPVSARRGLAGPGAAWQGEAGPGEARPGVAWRGAARHGSNGARRAGARHRLAGRGGAWHGTAWTRLGRARHGSAGQGAARPGKAWLGLARQDEARRGPARLGLAWRGGAWHGSARPGKAWIDVEKGGEPGLEARTRLKPRT